MGNGTSTPEMFLRSDIFIEKSDIGFIFVINAESACRGLPSAGAQSDSLLNCS